MFIDASAIVAILTQEEDGDELALRWTKAAFPTTSALAVYEASLAVARKTGADATDACIAVEELIQRSRTRVVPIDGSIGRAAVGAHMRYGKGRHPARLNMGDCFSYAMAKDLGVPLLYKGDDFARTDLAAPAGTAPTGPDPDGPDVADRGPA